MTTQKQPMSHDSSMITGRTKVVAVIGHPIEHSLSPAIHNAGFRSTGLDWVYVAFDVAAGSASAALDSVRTLGLAGLSVTMPHKQDIAMAVDNLSPSARNLASVNTVSVSHDGRLTGHSTDGDGLVASLQELGIDVEDRTVTIFGAGGAARSVIDSLERHRASRICVVNRTLLAAQRAIELAHGRGLAVSGDDRGTIAEFVQNSEIVINATSVGMSGSDDLVLDPRLLGSQHVVVDLVYHPLETPLLRAATERGCRVVDGIGMLVHQAALQQVVWTGVRPDVQEMNRVARQALS